MSTTSRTTLSPVGARPASAREQRRKSTGETPKDVESTKTVISFDFGYTYVDDYGNERSLEEVRDADDQYGTVLYIADHHTKAVHAVPLLYQGSPQPQVDGGGTGQVWHAGVRATNKKGQQSSLSELFSTAGPT